jgi:hypothetical protein
MLSTQLPPHLQCIIPVFEGLLPRKHNNIMLDLLFELAAWHGFAKLRIHTDKMINLLAAAIKTLTKVMQQFVWETCEAFTTVELPKEARAHG